MKEEKYGYTVFYLMNKPSYGYYTLLYHDPFSRLAMVTVFTIAVRQISIRQKDDIKKLVGRKLSELLH